MRTLALERMDEFRLCDESRQTGGRLQDYMHSHLENLIDRFRNALRTAGADLTGADTETDDREEGKSRIAQHGESAIALFEDIIENCARSASRHDLMLGYERILNYCKHMGLKGDVADRCISRIAELSHFEEASADGADGAASVALKIYLGQTLPMSGEYDVFISYKSEDEALAKKVYDYLTQSGKEVFFAKETLPQLGESEYRAAIFNALDHSRHMVVIGSNPDYLKTNWVKKEWDTFDNELTENEKKAGGTLILVLSDDIVSRKGALPIELRTKEIVKMSEFRSRLLSYLR